MLAELFRGGMADYLVIDAPSGLSLQASGGGYIVSLMAETGGDVPWSVYYAPGESSPERLDAQTRFCRALDRGMAFLNATPAAEYRDFLVRTFPRFDVSLLVQLVDIYRANGMWTTPRIDLPAYDRWQAAIADGHLVDAPIPYESLIDSRPTEDLRRVVPPISGGSAHSGLPRRNGRPAAGVETSSSRPTSRSMRR